MLFRSHHRPGGILGLPRNLRCRGRTGTASQGAEPLRGCCGSAAAGERPFGCRPKMLSSIVLIAIILKGEDFIRITTLYCKIHNLEITFSNHGNNFPIRITTYCFYANASIYDIIYYFACGIKRCSHFCGQKSCVIH